MQLTGYILVAFLFCIPVVIHRKVYLFPLSALRIDSNLEKSFVSVRPSKAFYRQFGNGLPVSSVVAKAGYVILAAPGSSDTPILYDSSVSFSSPVIILRRSRFGRYRSIDLSDRCLTDVLTKFSK